MKTIMRSICLFLCALCFLSALSSCSGITNYTRDILDGKYTIVSASASATSLYEGSKCVTGEDNRIAKITYNQHCILMEIVLKEHMDSKDIVFSSVSLENGAYTEYTTYKALKVAIPTEQWVEYDYWVAPENLR